MDAVRIKLIRSLDDSKRIRFEIFRLHENLTFYFIQFICLIFSLFGLTFINLFRVNGNHNFLVWAMVLAGMALITYSLWWFALVMYGNQEDEFLSRYGKIKGGLNGKRKKD